MCRSIGRTASVALLVTAWLAASDERAAAQPESGDNQTYVYGSPLVALLREELSVPSSVQTGAHTLSAEPLRRVYESRDYQAIWTGSSNAEDDARLALDALREAGADGLRAEDYRFAELSAMNPADDPGKAEFELLMTDSLLRYAHDLRSGRVRPIDVEDDIGLSALGFDFAGALRDAVASGSFRSFLTDLAPKHREYARLKVALVRYRELAAAGGWPAVPAGTTPDAENAERLRARLAVEDQGAAQGDLTEALRHYQQRNGLLADGRIGPRTLESLNVPVTTRIDQIRANMERWRWMPRELEPRHIAVNVAAATLQFVADGMSVLDSNVVVGNIDWRTPILRAEATAVTVNPVWHVPSSIAAREMWPAQRANPNYLQSHGLSLVDGQIRQPPGPRNALGSIKIEMPNDFGVYLHDTPAKAAFKRDARALSHGCVRVEQIAPLASLALSGDEHAAIGELSQIIATRKTTRIGLDARIPVYLLYWTAIADDDGHAGFPRDVYGRDPLLAAALDGARLRPRFAAELGP